MDRQPATAFRSRSTVNRPKVSPVFKTMPDGTFWTLTDNGFGAKANSSDAALCCITSNSMDNGKVDVVDNLSSPTPT